MAKQLHNFINMLHNSHISDLNRKKEGSIESIIIRNLSSQNVFTAGISQNPQNDNANECSKKAPN